jgi:hypothetical protein
MDDQKGDTHLDRERSRKKPREQPDNDADRANGLQKHRRAGKGAAGNEIVFRHHATDATESWAGYLCPAVHEHDVADNHISLVSPLPFMAFPLLLIAWRRHPCTEKIITPEQSKAIQRSVGRAIQYVEHAEGHGDKLFAAACNLGLEGIVSKKLDAPYRSGPSKTWIKVKNLKAPAATRAQDGTF